MLDKTSNKSILVLYKGGRKKMRKYITDNGYEMMLPEDDERVMTIEELQTKYDAAKTTKTANKPCPRCGTYCYGDCTA